MEDIFTNYINELTETITSKQKLLSAIYLRKSFEIKNTILSRIEDEFNQKIVVYSRNEENYKEEKEEILRRYTEEINKIIEEYHIKFISLQTELENAISNRYIAISNIKTIYKNKSSLIKKYGSNAPKEKIVNYNKTARAVIKKYTDYADIILECNKQLKDIPLQLENTITNIIKENKSLAVVKEKNGIVNLFMKIINKFIGKKKFENEVILAEDNNISEIERENVKILEKIDTDTMALIAGIKTLKQSIDTEYKAVVG